MKRMIYLMSIALVLSVLGVSCSKDNATSSYNAADDVADEIAASLGSSNSGLSSEITDVANLGDDYTAKAAFEVQLDTLYSVDTSFAVQNPAGTLITYSYSYQLEYGYVFGNGGLSNMYYNGEVSGEFDAPRLGSSDLRNSNWVLTGLDFSSSEYILNGTTTRTGSSQSKIRNKTQITSTSQISLSNVKVNKSTYVITEGTLSWTISGKANGESYSYSAVVTYLGNGKAELTLDGTEYTIDIASGEVE